MQATNLPPSTEGPSLRIAEVELDEGASFDSPSPSASRRAVWRQFLVDAERGLVSGFRSDSRLVVELFITAVVVLTGLVIGLGLSRWALVGMSICGWLSLELFAQALRSTIAEISPATRTRVERLTIAATTVMGAGALFVSATILAERFFDMFG